jgi:hypothetical protein
MPGAIEAVCYSSRNGAAGLIRSPCFAAADGKQIVFDRMRKNSDIVLIDLAR